MRALLVFAAALFSSSIALADPPRTKVTDVCAGCVASWPEGEAAVPLLVVLHGDYGEPAAGLHRAWEPHAAARGVALLSLACPASEGCKGSWWQWNGSPAWIEQQVDKVAQRRAIDRDRVYLAGWSGGATYIGFRTQELEKRFAAFVIHGGGYPPSSTQCGAEPTSVFFLAGDGNPLHGHAVRLRDHYLACKADVSWNLLRGADHPQEWNALARRGADAMDFLLRHSKRRP